MKKKCLWGFSLIEFMVYLIAFACVITIALHAVVTVTQKSRTSSKQINETLQLLVALDCISFYLAEAPSEKNDWYVQEKNCCIWHSKAQRKDIGFSFVKNKLIKTSGVYSTNNKKWISKVSNTLVKNIINCSFEIESCTIGSSEQIQALHCFISTQASTISKKISINNGYCT